MKSKILGEKKCVKKNWVKKIFLGEKRHWRQIDQTLCTLLTSNKIIQKYWNELTSMCKIEHYPFEKPLHNIYKKELCVSPIPSLAVHFTNINSIYGLSPNVNWKKLWDENPGSLTIKESVMENEYKNPSTNSYKNLVMRGVLNMNEPATAFRNSDMSVKRYAGRSFKYNWLKRKSYLNK